MKSSKFKIAILIGASLLLQACNAVDQESAIQTALAATQQISQLQTAAAGNLATATPVEDDSDDATSTPSVPLVSVSQLTNCRTGPSTHYGFEIVVSPGQDLEVLATYESANYVVVRQPDGTGDCWLWLQYANETDFDDYDLPVATQPPTPEPTATPTPDYAWDGSWTMWVDSGGGTLSQCSLTLSEVGNSLDGTFGCPSWNGEVHGTLSADRSTASGDWSNNQGVDGTFQWMLKKNVFQFVGNYSGYAWCGASQGASQPTPCLGP